MMPTLEAIAEQLAGLYCQLMARDDTPESTLDALFDAVAGLDTAGGGLLGGSGRAEGARRKGWFRRNTELTKRVLQMCNWSVHSAHDLECSRAFRDLSPRCLALPHTGVFLSRICLCGTVQLFSLTVAIGITR